MRLFIILLLQFLFLNMSCQKKNKESDTKKNPLLCDTETGVCEIENQTQPLPKKNEATNNKQIKIIYFTDPICSSCWGIEPQLRKLKLEYGSKLKIEYRMGGLLKDWSYNSGGISKPSDVAHHWDEVSISYDMPIDGDVWLEDPLDSSYPASIAFKAAQLQGEDKALLFLREIREMVFIRKINIAKWSNLKSAAQHVGLNLTEFENDYNNKAKTLFKEDLELASSYTVRGFPTMYILGKDAQKELVYGARPYAFYENAIQKIYPKIVKDTYDTNWKSLFEKYHSFTAREFSELSKLPRNNVEKLLNELTQKEYLTKLSTKNGAIWTLKKTIQ